MKEIKLTQGQVALVDDDDYEWLSQWKWSARYSPRTKSFYALGNSPRVGGKSKTILMHRLIMRAAKGEEVDHGNHVTLDNQRSNLRITTGQGNSQNKRLRSDNASGECGVYWHKRDKKWEAQIFAGGKLRYLGRFATKGAAIFARKAASCQYGFHVNHGSKAAPL